MGRMYFARWPETRGEWQEIPECAAGTLRRCMDSPHGWTLEGFELKVLDDAPALAGSNGVNDDRQPGTTAA